MQVAFAQELMQEHISAAADQLLHDPPAAGSTAAKTQLLGLLQGILYTIVGFGSTFAGHWEHPQGAWAVVGQVWPPHLASPAALTGSPSSESTFSTATCCPMTSAAPVGATAHPQSA